ncbi:MAG: serine/threonine-protein kinase [Proteobacteria bacterium]|nr:serine/threonine-protein kinase [Pseudomonadota bacterium]
MQKLADAPKTKKLSRLSNLIEQYNAIADNDENGSIRKIFLLQKMNNFIQHNLDNNDVVAWRNKIGESGFESHLQHYGIHRDSSQLLQSVEFANAVRHFTPNTPPIKTTTNNSFYNSMQKRNDLLAKEPTPEILDNYIKESNVIVSYYASNDEFQEKMRRHADYLALSYAKVEAIQGLVNQNFNEYQTDILGHSTGNNKNFIFNIEGVDKNLVIRVEDRYDFGGEFELQTEPVSEYFSEDYVTLMMPFEEDGSINYQPVVISEFAEKGDLKSYAGKLKGKSAEQVVDKATFFFADLCDFSKKLMDSGHYHPDIKLSNFLTDGNRIILSDRKTLTSIRNPRVYEISSSPMYGAPEYQQCVGDGELNAKAYRTTLDMPSYMSYQIGMALKEFMSESGIIPIKKDEEEAIDQYLEWNSITKDMKKAPNNVRNISILIQELTRFKPEERLTLEHFNYLLNKLDLPRKNFLQELNKLSPSKNLSSNENVKFMRQLLKADTLTTEIEEKLGKLTGQEIQNALNDPRLNLRALLKGKPEERINDYLDAVKSVTDDLLLKRDLKSATSAQRFLHKLTNGRSRVPRVSTLEDIKDDLPKMDKLTSIYIDIYLEHRGALPKISNSDRNRLAKLSEFEAISDATQIEKTVVAESPKIKKEYTQAEALASDTVVVRDEGTVVVRDEGTVVVRDEGTVVVRDEGTVVVRDENTVVVRDENTVVVRDEGTVVVRDEGTVVVRDEGTVVVRDEGTVVVRDSDKTQTNHSKHELNINRALAFADPAHKKSLEKARVVTDIISTIERGNNANGMNLKAALKDMKKTAETKTSELDTEIQTAPKGR